MEKVYWRDNAWKDKVGVYVFIPLKGCAWAKKLSIAVNALVTAHNIVEYELVKMTKDNIPDYPGKRPHIWTPINQTN